MGCAPCQPFSKYTQRYRKRGRNDDKWKLLYSFSKLIDDLNPSIISMENVPELEREKVFHDFVKHLENKGYNFEEYIIIKYAAILNIIATSEAILAPRIPLNSVNEPNVITPIISAHAAILAKFLKIVPSEPTFLLTAM